MIESLLMTAIIFCLGGVGGCWYGRRAAVRSRKRVIVEALTDDEIMRLEGVREDDLYWNAPLHIAEAREQLVIEMIAGASRSGDDLKNLEGFIQGLEAFKEAWLELREKMRLPARRVEEVEAG